MHNKDRITDHQEQQAHKDNTNHSQQIPPESVKQSIRTENIEDI